MELKEIIKETVTQSVTAFFLNKDVETIHVLDDIFPKERRIRSLIGGLETSLGTRLWEPLARAFASENGFEVLDQKILNKTGIPLLVPNELQSCFSKWKTKRQLYEGIPLDGYVQELRDIIKSLDLSEVSYTAMPKGEGVDVWLRKDNIEYLFDIKTNQINAGGGPKYNETIMRWYLYRLMVNPDLEISCQIAFPFNPYKRDFWQVTIKKAEPLIPNVDALVENDFWDFLSGHKDTWSIINDTFKELGKENFGKQFENIFSNNINV